MSPEPDASLKSSVEPSWSAKVLALADTLSRRGVPHAFGGAIAMNYHREPRSTLDIDINIFLVEDGVDEVLGVFGEVYGLPDLHEVRGQIVKTGQARTLWGQTYVDLFFANTDFHHSMSQRVQQEPFGEREITVLSIEDLVVCKVLFDRPKDWVDIDAVARTRRGALDYRYIRRWLGAFLDDDDRRLVRLAEIEHRIT